MAEFSKQWAEKHDPEFGHDFDILEIANTLEPNYYTSIICEGYGFIAIGKDEHNNIILAMPTGHSEQDEEGNYYDDVVWKSYEEIIN